MHLMCHIVYIVSIVKISRSQSSDCYDFWTRWSSCPKMSQFPRSMSACFKSTDKSFVFLDYEIDTAAHILCEYKTIDFELLTCLGVSHLHTVYFNDCLFPKNSVREVLRHTNPKEIHVFYNQTQRLEHDFLLFDKLPETEKIIIVGARGSQSINISFDDVPSLSTISLLETDFSFFKSRLPVFPSVKNFASCRGSTNENEIPADFFNHTTSLMFINLGENCFSDLPTELFYGLPTIYTIRLHHNCFTSIRSEWFHGLDSLIYLDLSYNNLTRIPDNLFYLARNIEFFNISSNLQMILSDDTLREAKNLVEFRADNCSLSSVPPNLLKTANRLSYISIAANALTHLSPSLFSSQRVLRSISIQNNRLTSIPEGLFSNLDSLEKLIIYNNEIRSIEYNAFSGLTNLIELDLHSNKLEILNNSVFSNLVKLHILDLSNNFLKTLSEDTYFGNSKYLQVINVSRNSLTEFPSVSWKMHGVMLMDCDYNNMTTVCLDPKGKNGTVVTLRSNPIRTIRLTQDYTTESQLVRFLLKTTVLACNCDLQQFLNFIGKTIGRQAFPNATEMECSAPRKWKNVLVTNVIPVHSVCPLETDCPINCHCFTLAEGGIFTNCTTATLTQPPTVLPFGTSILYLTNNNISSLSKVESTSWNNITNLYLTNNTLVSLEHWTVPPNLHLLAVNGNRLTGLPLAIMEKVDITPEFKIYLARNDWQCNCDSVLFKKWFIRNKQKIVDYNHILCNRTIVETSRSEQSLLRDVPLDLFCPLLQSVRSSQVIAVVLSVVSIALLMICSFVVHYRYNNTIMAFLYSHKLYFSCCEKRDEDKTFDAFVCYSTVDRQIALEIMTELEPLHKLCIHERDWLPGYPISSHIVNSVQNSRKTLLLLSKDFLESIWFQVEFRTAYNQMLEDRVYRLVVVVVGELGDVNQLEDDLRHLLATKTYLQWGEKWFWEKLRYALRSRGTKHGDGFQMKDKHVSYSLEGFVQQSNETEISTVSQESCVA